MIARGIRVSSPSDNKAKTNMVCAAPDTKAKQGRLRQGRKEGGRDLWGGENPLDIDQGTFNSLSRDSVIFTKIQTKMLWLRSARLAETKAKHLHCPLRVPKQKHRSRGGKKKKVSPFQAMEVRCQSYKENILTL